MIENNQITEEQKKNAIVLKDYNNTNKIIFYHGYSLFKVIETIENTLFNDTFFHFKPLERKLYIKDMDYSRISLIEINIRESDLVQFEINRAIQTEKDKVGVNLTFLSSILKQQKSNSKEVSISFNHKDSKLIISKVNKKIETTKTLDYLDKSLLEQEKDEVNLEHLTTIEYDNYVEIEKQYLEELFYESGTYSEIIIIEFSEDGLHFKEIGVTGECDNFIEKEKLETFSSNNGISSYALTFFSLIKKFFPIMTKNDIISIYLKTDTPLKVHLHFQEISCDVVFFIAPRCKEYEECDFEEDDEF